jgi:hypothetical protein
VSNASGLGRRDRGLLAQKAHRAEDQVVEVERAGRRELLLVER